ncbi:serine/threonine-protein kinase [Acanthopleuribacter pedis]|uniref:Protein kinase n=1 Tax=Acanthopleuribacter pedis TaxID=442870 RepID=A0A8J7U3N5_9BACT|nr:serine/threonine-protein kinase [Acanthopleuribacter pedis]MBO1320613.1 protein kinase [Acanthopleuribacter pedis]
MNKSPDRGRLAALFAELCDLGKAERETYLTQQQLPPALEQELRSLLACDEDAETFLEKPVSSLGNVLLSEEAPAEPDQVPGCELVRLLGEGGMGRVWEAQQLKPIKRRVAVKVVKSGHLFDRDEMYQRFRGERQTLAQMNHPNIAQIYGGGQTEKGEPFLLMEYVEQGTPLLEYCQKERLDLNRRLDLFFQVCRGVKHAHQKGIIHRDLKPANILVKILDKKPVVKIIDFGVSAQTLHLSAQEDQPKVTGFLAGTPMYMAPEQADVHNLDIDTQTDVYALSVVLYQLICGCTPFRDQIKPGSDFNTLRGYIADKRAISLREHFRGLSPEAVRIACNNLAIRKAQWRRLCYADMNAVILKGLAADRRERYESVAALMDDLRAFCEHRPVSAVPATTLYTARRFIRRNRNLLGVTALIFVSLCFGLISAGISLMRLSRSQAQVLAESRKNEQILNALDTMFKDAAPDSAGKVDVLTMLQDTSRRWNHPLYVRDKNPELQAEMHLALGRIYRSLSHFHLAEPHLQQAVTLIGETSGKQSPTYLEALFEHGMLLSATGHHQDALNLLRKITVWNKLNLGDLHERTLVAQVHLGGCYLQLGQLNKAEHLLQRSTEQIAETFEPHHPIVGYCKRSLALTLIKRHQFNDAEKLLLSLNRADRARLPENHPDLMMNMHLLSLAVGQKPHPTLETHLVRSLVNPRWYSGAPKHEDDIGNLLEDGDNAFKTQEFAKAEEIYNYAYQVGRELLGPEHRQTQKAAAALSKVLARRGKHSETLAIARDHEKIARMQFGHTHPITLTLREYRNHALRAQGKHGELNQMIMQEFLLAKNRPRQRLLSELRESNEIVKIYVAQNRLEQAHTMALDNLEACRRLLPAEGGPELIPLLETLADIQYVLDQRYAAEQYLQEALILARDHREQAPHLLQGLHVKFPNHIQRLERLLGDRARAEPTPARQASNPPERVRTRDLGTPSTTADQAEMVTNRP